MAVQEISVDLGQLNGGIYNLSEKVADVRRLMGELHSSMTQLNSMWTGEANAEFIRQFNADNASMEDVCKSIDKMISEYRHAHSEYVKCENQISGIISSIRI